MQIVESKSWVYVYALYNLSNCLNFENVHNKTLGIKEMNIVT